MRFSLEENARPERFIQHRRADQWGAHCNAGEAFCRRIDVGHSRQNGFVDRAHGGQGYRRAARNCKSA